MALPVVTGNQTTTLAWFAELAYEDSWTADQLGGWHAVSGSELGISDSLLSNGLYEYQNGAALVTSANFNGSDVLCIAFRGSDDDADWVTNITDIDEHFELFYSLSEAAQAALDAGTYDAILVTGHSLGGAMTEVYLHTYSDPNIYGISWGSPGIHMDEAEADSRLVNYVFADDGVAWLGTQRDDIADEVNLWSLGDVADIIDTLGISAWSVVAALNDLDSDYQHQGTTAIISADGGYVGSFSAGITLDSFENYVDTHDMGRYLVTSTSLNANPFDIPDSTIVSSQLTATETSMLELYDTVFDSLPGGETFSYYSGQMASGTSELDIAAALLDSMGTLSRDEFIDELFMNVLGREATTWELQGLFYGNNQPAHLVVKLANSQLEENAVGTTVDLVEALGWYNYY